MNSLCRLQPEEEHGIRRDIQPLKKAYRLDRIMAEPNSRVLYYLKGSGLEHNFVAEKMMQITEGVEVPPEYVKK